MLNSLDSLSLGMYSSPPRRELLNIDGLPILVCTTPHRLDNLLRWWVYFKDVCMGDFNLALDANETSFSPPLHLSFISYSYSCTLFLVFDIPSIQVFCFFVSSVLSSCIPSSKKYVYFSPSKTNKKEWFISFCFHDELAYLENTDLELGLEFMKVLQQEWDQL